MPSRLLYDVGEIVLVRWGSLLYVAKCLKAEENDVELKYYVHFVGWKRRWDQWVPQFRLMKHNSKNLQKLKDLQEAVKAKKCSVKRRRKNGQSNRVVHSTQSPGESPSSSQNTLHVQTMENRVTKLAMDIPLSPFLRSVLAEDYMLICKKRKLVRLPANPTVREIVQDYLEDVSRASNSLEQKIRKRHFANGLWQYFRHFLGKRLLYRFETAQYKKACEAYPGVPVTQLYGAVHLLRFFKILNDVVPRNPGDEEDIRQLEGHLQHFLRYLDRQGTSLFGPRLYGPSRKINLRL